jgi:hypothetical protein
MPLVWSLEVNVAEEGRVGGSTVVFNFLSLEVTCVTSSLRSLARTWPQLNYKNVRKPTAALPNTPILSFTYQ